MSTKPADDPQSQLLRYMIDRDQVLLEQLKLHEARMLQAGKNAKTQTPEYETADCKYKELQKALKGPSAAVDKFIDRMKREQRLQRVAAPAKLQ